MITLIADDTKQFMNCLVKSEAFDNFLIYNFSIDTLYNLSIDGKINDDYLSSDEKEIFENQTYVSYTQIKPLLIQILKQSHTPTGMKITFSLNHKSTEDIQRRLLGDSVTLPVQGFLINLVFDGEKVRITTGTNYSQFTLDKSIEQSFDQMMRQFFKKNDLLMLDI